ncbi:MAG TPA: glycosyltransferase family 2 protein [Terracidiphilus sp.]|nr:glycosyltransferase family 2 protein [Terracidiphilus sp.]
MNSEIVTVAATLPAATSHLESGCPEDAVDIDRGQLPELSIIIVNWNSLDYLIRCIESIFANRPEVPFEIVVVDNASPEGGLESLADRFPSVRLIRSETNLGFAGANNVGFRHSRGQYILLLNPDTKVIGSAISLMLNQLRALPDAGIVGSTLLNSDLTVSTTSIQKFPTILNQLLTAEWLRLRLPALPLWDIAPLFRENKGPVKVEVIPGACMMLKRDVFERAGMFTEDYFMYAEDIDLNLKVSRLGFSSYYIADARIIHHGGCSSTQQAVSQWSTVMVQRAMLRFFRRNHGKTYAMGFRLAMGISAVGRLVILLLARPFSHKQKIQWAAEKWSIVLKWSLGFKQLESSR